MGTGHHHSHHGAAEPPLNATASRWLWIAVGVCGVVTVAAVLLLWPGSSDRFEDPLLLDADTIDANVVAVERVDCSFDQAQSCALVEFELTSGQTAGEIGTIEQGTDGSLSVGDSIVVTAFEDRSGTLVYSFYEYQRTAPMLWLAALFVAAVLLLGRWRGLGAIGGLVFSLLVIVVFTLPAVLDGSDAVWVALASASLIAFAALFLAHGFTAGTAVALLSTFASLVATATLAGVFVAVTNLTGRTDDSSALLSGLEAGIDPQGILLAGIVIGALGVLDDVTVTQVSAVWELKRVQPDLTTSELVAPAMRIGRDHISSTVNTLFLAYVGAALPFLLLFTQADQGLGNVLTREIVATEVVRALVGSIGLVASVPISTWLAAIVVSADRRPVARQQRPLEG